MRFAGDVARRHTEPATGNFPQAFSHVGLINVAHRLAALTDREAEEV